MSDGERNVLPQALAWNTRNPMSKEIDPERSAAAAILGGIGGRKATGEKKRRNPEHYAKMVENRTAKAGIRKAQEAAGE